MEDNQSLVCPKEEKRETEEIQNEVSSNGVEAANVDQCSQLETLVVAFDSEELKPTISTPLASLASPEFKIEQFETSRQEDLAIVTAHAQTHMQVQVGYSYSPSELLPVPIKQSLSSRITPSPLRQRPPPLPQYNTPELNQENSNQKMEFAHVLVKSSSPDEYNWRKYGQKPVKSNDSSRSYYRCTHSNCHAKKKVECCDHSGHVIEIIYKGQHNHDPPQKTRHTKPRIYLSTVGNISSPEPGEGIGNLDSPAGEGIGNLSYARTEQELHNSIDYASNAIVKSEDNCDHTCAKRRMKGRNVADIDPLIKTVKDPKIVVQASGDTGMSSDGYRWRKYGQKMVKGNSNPRSYYKCTSAGCPVRKHVERATDNTTTIVITYEGKHDHDMPVPKKHQGQPSSDLIAAATNVDAEVKKSEDVVHPQSSTQLSMDVEREVGKKNASELGSEKPLESARTLLSVGIELRPY